MQIISDISDPLVDCRRITVTSPAYIRWDFSKLLEVCARYLADDAARKAITTGAYQVLADYHGSHNAL
jgi:hypothetical protein